MPLLFVLAVSAPVPGAGRVSLRRIFPILLIVEVLRNLSKHGGAAGAGGGSDARAKAMR